MPILIAASNTANIFFATFQFFRACILAVVGVFKIVNGLREPLWIGIALALPGFVWASDRLYQTFSSETLLISKLGLDN